MSIFLCEGMPDAALASELDEIGMAPQTLQGLGMGKAIDIAGVAGDPDFPGLHCRQEMSLDEPLEP